MLSVEPPGGQADVGAEPLNRTALCWSLLVLMLVFGDRPQARSPGFLSVFAPSREIHELSMLERVSEHQADPEPVCLGITEGQSAFELTWVNALQAVAEDRYQQHLAFAILRNTISCVFRP
ncbi:MAG: hypothetical protein C1943_10965 [Halochromatium sp.]|nr:hypothetical protein [Halochromatium sp.]